MNIENTNNENMQIVDVTDYVKTIVVQELSYHTSNLIDGFCEALLENGVEVGRAVKIVADSAVRLFPKSPHDEITLNAKLHLGNAHKKLFGTSCFTSEEEKQIEDHMKKAEKEAIRMIERLNGKNPIRLETVDLTPRGNAYSI